jgi:hypothetical protein
MLDPSPKSRAHPREIDQIERQQRWRLLGHFIDELCPFGIRGGMLEGEVDVRVRPGVVARPRAKKEHPFQREGAPCSSDDL